MGPYTHGSDGRREVTANDVASTTTPHSFLLNLMGRIHPPSMQECAECRKYIIAHYRMPPTVMTMCSCRNTPPELASTAQVGHPSLSDEANVYPRQHGCLSD